MSLKAIFVGINKYRDPSLFDLHGAKLDAIALEALFSDSVSGLQTTLLLDEAATVESTRDALEHLLRQADPEDQIIVFFAGHGASTHHLVLHNSCPQDAGTMISMQELARQFRESPAKSILAILDCCFSGEAPARVISDGPRSRGTSLNYVELFSGNGRSLISASSSVEPAWEHPGNGHGLLTKAIIDVLTSAKEGMGIGNVTDQVVRLVQADAQRLGTSQTPVFVNYSEGGLLLPALRPGVKYMTAFPERGAAPVSQDLNDLRQCGIPEVIVDVWKKRFPQGLNAFQVQAVNDGGVLRGANVLAIAPTGAGKTFVGEMAAIRAVSNERRAVFLLPYRALVNEKYEDFLDIYGGEVGLRIIRCSGDYLDDTSAFVRGKYDIALLTYEMFLSLCVGNRSVLNHIGLLVIDEAQFITDPKRGIVIELLLTLIISQREVGLSSQIVALSAVIGDVRDFDRWLDAKKVVTTIRPVPLIEGVIDRSGTFQFIDVDGSERTEQLIPHGSVVVRRVEQSAQDVIVPLVKQLVANGETVIIFRNQKGSAEGCANYLADELGLPSSEAALRLTQFDGSSTTRLLHKCLCHGVACHTSNLTREERILVERSFRQASGGPRVIAATTTLAAGINTPASTVILAEQEFVGEDGRPFTVAEYKNMAGRAGRPGYGRPGRAIIYAETPYQRASLMQKYVRGEPEAIKSSFDVSDVDTWILRLLGQVNEVGYDEVVRLLGNTFGGYVATLANPNWPTETSLQIRGCLETMLSLGLLEREQDRIHLSLLGKACSRSALSFRSAMRLVELLRTYGSTPSPGQLMVLVQGLQELDDIYTPLLPNARAEKALPAALAARIGDGLVNTLSLHAGEQKIFLQRCKRSLVLSDWIAGVFTGQIENTYSPSPYGGKISLGHIRGFADATRFHLRAAAEIAQVLYPLAEPSQEDLDGLLKSLELGVPTDMYSLLKIRVEFNRGELLMLRGAGITNEELFWLAAPDQLRDIFSATKLAKIMSLKPR